MTTLPHDSPLLWWRSTELWASLAITAMWLAVALTALAGPEIKSVDNIGNATVIPAAVVVALFATIGSWAVARYAFRRRDDG